MSDGSDLWLVPPGTGKPGMTLVADCRDLRDWGSAVSQLDSVHPAAMAGRSKGHGPWFPTKEVGDERR